MNCPSFFVDRPGSYVAQLVVMDSGNGTSKDFTVVNSASTVNSLIAVEHAGYKQACKECHNGITATGRPVNHIAATEVCVVCHSIEAWSPNIAIDHNEIFGICSNCHNGSLVLGKPTIHIETSSECNQCHVAGTTFSVANLPSAAENGLGVVGILSDEDEDEESDHPMIGDMMCIDCHNNVIEEGKPDDHIMTTDHCVACHSTNDWDSVMAVDHAEVIGECSSCHNNDIADGKPSDHIATTSECNACHSTAAWTPTNSGGGGGVGTVDHTSFTAATVCMECHDGTIATGKSPTHLTTTSDCDVCHNTVAWVSGDAVVGTVDHTVFTAATVCMDCHNGSTAIGKSTAHLVTDLDCDTCHTTLSFTAGLAAVDHAIFTAATVCMDCHNGTLATGKPQDHPTTVADCDSCHTTDEF